MFFDELKKANLVCRNHYIQAKCFVFPHINCTWWFTVQLKTTVATSLYALHMIEGLPFYITAHYNTLTSIKKLVFILLHTTLSW